MKALFVQPWKRLRNCTIWLIFFIVFLFLIMSMHFYFRYYTALVSFPICRTPGVNEEKCQFGDNNRRLNALERIENVTIFYRNQNVKLSRCSSITGRRILISFASDCCETSQVVNCKSALEVGGFDACVLFGPGSIDADFKRRHVDPLLQQSKRGFGFWVWKPYIILRTLLEMNDDDYLFYADSGSEFVNNVDTGLICMQHHLQKEVILFHLDYKDRHWTKADAFVITGCNTTKCQDSNQILASFILLHRSFTSIQFVSEWLAYATDARAVSDQPSVLMKDPPFFIDHRHDQSLLSLVAKKWGFADESLPDPSQYGEEDRKLSPTPYGFANQQYILHTRIKV